ncbi:hypothetical protein [Nitratireductor aestuarii]|nr:hypothetical protein [Nitratireductor aestuarii]
MYWPSGQYLTTASITNLHNVRHRGSGSVKRGSALFYVEPGKSNSNIIYVATTGNANNDGLSASQPINTMQGGLNAMESYGPVLNGSWTLQVAAGTYAEEVTTGLRSANAVNIKGPDVSGGVPTVILDGGSGARSFGIYAGPYINFNVFDIKAQNYSAYGFVAHNASMMNLYNCHSSGSTEAQANAEDRSRLYILGGIYNGGKYGVRIYSQSTGSIRKDTRYNTAAQFNNATAAGIYIRENSNARADDFTSNGCGIAANAANGRLHIVNATITNAPVACQADRGGEMYDDGVTYGTGVTVRRRRLSGGRFLAQSSAVSENSFINTAELVHTGSTTLATLWQGPSIEALELSNPGRAIEVEIRGKWGSGATATTLYIALEGSTGNLSQVNSPTNSPNVFVIRAVIIPRGVNSQLVHTELFTHAAASFTATAAPRTVDVSTDRAIQVRALLGNSADSVTIDYIKITRLG